MCEPLHRLLLKGGTQKWKTARNKKNKLAVSDGIKIYGRVKDGKKLVDTYI